MNLHDLETFVSIAQLGGVTRAAPLQGRIDIVVLKATDSQRVLRDHVR
jgi:hypothetical protein